MSIFSKMKWFFNPKPLKRIDIKRKVIADVSSFAKDAYPKEFLAFFEGRISKQVLEVQDIIFQPYIASTHSALPRIDFPLTSQVVGSIQSHPSRSARPSNADKNFFRKVGIVNAIIKYPYNMDDVVYYDSEGDEIHINIID